MGVGSRLEVNLDQTHAGQRTGFDVIDVAPQREEALERVGDVRLDLFRRHSRVESRNHYHRNLDLRKQIHRHSNHGGHTDHRNYQANHDHEKRVLQSESRHYFGSPVWLSLALDSDSVSGFTTSPVW